MKRFVKRCKAAASPAPATAAGCVASLCRGGAGSSFRPAWALRRLSQALSQAEPADTRARVDTAEPEPAGSGGPGWGCLLAAFALASTLALRSCEDAREYVQKMDLHSGLLWSRLRATMGCRLDLSLCVPFFSFPPTLTLATYLPPCLSPPSREKSQSRDSRLGNLAKMSDQVSPPSLPPSLSPPPLSL